MDFWLNLFPLQGALAKDDALLNRTVELSSAKNAPNPEKKDVVMLKRNRLSRIFYLQNV